MKVKAAVFHLPSWLQQLLIPPERRTDAHKPETEGDFRPSARPPVRPSRLSPLLLSRRSGSVHTRHHHHRGAAQHHWDDDDYDDDDDEDAEEREASTDTRSYLDVSQTAPLQTSSTLDRGQKTLFYTLCSARMQEGAS